MVRSLVVAFACVLALAPSLVEAQSASVRSGAELYMSADFEGAIVALEAALADQTLSLADVELALDRIAAARSAIGDAPGLSRTLAWLAAIAPSHLFGPDVPAELSAQFVAVLTRASPVTLEVLAQPTLTPGEVRVRASTAGDSSGAVRSVLLRCTLGDRVEQASGEAPALTVRETADCDAVAEGPGGIALASGHRAGAVPPSSEPASGSGPDPLVLGLGIGGGVLALGLVIGIVVGVAIGGGGGTTDGGVLLSAPAVRW